MNHGKNGGTGIYDAECAQVALETSASGVVLIVFDGAKGSGFSFVSSSPHNAKVLIKHLPQVLRETADAIDADNAANDGSFTSQYFRRDKP